MRAADSFMFVHVSKIVFALQRTSHGPLSQRRAVSTKKNALSIVDKTERSRIDQLRFDPRQRHRHIRRYPRHLVRVLRAQIEFPCGPGGDEGVEVVEVPCGGVPGEGHEEFDGHFVGLEVADVEDPDAGGFAVDGEGELFVDL
jgi:hypothetical protein